MMLVRIIKIIGYVVILGMCGYFLYQELGWKSFLIEVAIVIFTTIPEKLRVFIFGKKRQTINKESFEHKEKLKYSNLDPDFEHVYVIFFYPENLSWEKGERGPSKNNPRYKYIINNRTHKAFYVTVYAMSLLKPIEKIQWYSKTFTSVEDTKQILKDLKIRLIEKPATESDLLDTENPYQKIKRIIMSMIGIW